MRRINRCAILLAALALIVILSGAFITSTEVAARLAQSASPSAFEETAHRVLGIAIAALTLVLAAWTFATPRFRPLVLASAAVLVGDAALGWATSLSPGQGVAHALLAHLFFSLMVAICVATSSGWQKEPERVDGGSRPLLRPLALSIPPVVFLQIVLGAMYRHAMSSVMPHMAVAMGVAFLALISSSVILQNFPRPASMRRAAIALISVVLAQVTLGITSFILIVLNMTGTPYFLMAATGHVAVGAATLAASVATAMEVRRSVLPKKA